MPGMNSDLNPASPILVSAFRSALLQQWLIVALIFAAAAHRLGRGAHRDLRLDGGSARAAAPDGGASRAPGCCCGSASGSSGCSTGILQAQPQMPGGLADQVIQPTASTSPGWVQHLVNYGVNLWDYHPITAATASVWIQVGIGLWMLLAVRGWSARLAGPRRAWPGDWSSGRSASRSAGSSRPASPSCSARPARCSSTSWPGALLALPERAWDSPRARPPPAWRDGRVLPRHDAAPGLAGARLLAGHARRPARVARRHDRSPWRARRSRTRSTRSSPGSATSPPRTGSRSTWSRSSRSR